MLQEKAKTNIRRLRVLNILTTGPVLLLLAIVLYLLVTDVLTTVQSCLIYVVLGLCELFGARVIMARAWKKYVYNVMDEDLNAPLFMEILQMITTGSAYFTDVNHLLHNLLTIVVGMEFVRMLIDTTPANILEVLTVAITRHVILSHDDPWSNMACIACIASLFAIRRFLIRRSELKEEMVEID